MKLHTFWRSSAAYRVRIALALKELEPEMVYVHLRRDGGEQRKPGYRALNPQALVPTLELDDGTAIGQSLAILEYLEETVPQPPLLPAAPWARARVRSIANLIACEIHPLNNLRTLHYLRREMGHAREAVDGTWYHHWIRDGFDLLEAELGQRPAGSRYCWGDRPTMADCCLVPQVANARRMGVEIGGYRTILAIDEALRALPAFERAAPENQGDAEPE
jgi:maleylacetoacetate isomerase